MLQKIRTLSFIPEKRPRLHYDPDTTSLTPCFLVVRRRFERAAPIVFSDVDIVMVAIVGAVLALVAVIVLDSMFGSL